MSGTSLCKLSETPDAIWGSAVLSTANTKSAVRGRKPTDGHYYKDDPYTKRRANATRRTITGPDGKPRRIYPSDPRYAMGRPVAHRPQGAVYVVVDRQHPGVVKIGKAKDPQARLNRALTFCYRPAFHLLYTRATSDMHTLEWNVHRRLHNYRDDREWFHMDQAYAIQVVDEEADKLKETSDTEQNAAT